MGSPGGWFGYSATVSKPGWDGSEERTEAMKTACLPWQPGCCLCLQPSGDAELSIPLFICAQEPPGLWAPKHSWSHTIFKITLYNSKQLPALQFELCHPRLCSQPGTYHQERVCEVYGVGIESMLELQPS